MKNKLVGLFGTNGDYQGYVVSKLNDDKYLFQHFEALMGTSSDMKIYTLDELKEYSFYEDVEDMKEHIKRYQNNLEKETNLDLV
jgi:hypothetical protein